MAVAANAGIAEITPHPDTGKLKVEREPDRPILSAYGGVGLRKMPDGHWNGYSQTSPQDVEYLIRRCAENGISRIYAAFDEEDESAQNFDYIELFIQLAHENQIEVYATQPIFGYVVSKEKTFAEANPNCFTRLASGELDTHMLSAAYEEVRRYKQNVFLSWIQRYPLDGLQLDFIRYPYYTNDLREGFCKHGYDGPSLELFRRQYGYGEDYVPACDDPRWVALRSDSVTTFIRELRSILKAKSIELPLGVFNSGQFGRQDSYRTVLQDWRQWEREQLVEEHCPMFLMTHGLSNLSRSVESLVEVRNGYSQIFGPVFLAEGFEPHKGDIPTPDTVRDVSRRMIKLGCDGIWWCRLAEIEEFGLWPVVHEISEWSVSEIRDEVLDPFHENLLGDEHQLNWNPEAGSENRISLAAEPGLNGNISLQITLSPDSETTLSRTLSFRPVPYGPVDSLALDFCLKSQDIRCDGDSGIVFNLKYQNGVTEEVVTPLNLGGDDWENAIAVCSAKTDYAGLLLTEARIEIIFPAGSGTVWLADLDLERDTLLALREEAMAVSAA